MPRRRSSRLRAIAKHTHDSSRQPAALDAINESSSHDSQFRSNGLASSPIIPRTPQSSDILQPGKKEMHPSKAHQSTAKKPDSGLRLGFVDIDANSNNPLSGANQQSPSKAMPTSTFEFCSAHPIPQMGPRALRMLDELRDDALIIKEKLAAQKDATTLDVGEHSEHGTRKIAHPKGRAGRFSDIHLADFRKMDSIANHASAFRAQNGRPMPAPKSLKRTQSKARLDDPEEDSGTKGHNSRHMGRGSDNSAPTKRIRKHKDDDASSGRPVSRGDGYLPTQPSTPGYPGSHPKYLASITTPTQASLARATTIKATQIPTLSRSPSKANLTGTPRGISKSATTNNIVSGSSLNINLPSSSRLERVKSILKSVSNSTKKASAPSAIPTLTKSPSKVNLQRSLPLTPHQLQCHKHAKHVNFTSNSVDKVGPATQQSPSPVKPGNTGSTFDHMLSNNLLAGERPMKSFETHVRYPNLHGQDHADLVQYPSLAEDGALPPSHSQVNRRTPPAPFMPSSFTFRSDHTINFGAPPKGFGSSPGQASLRQVRQSCCPVDVPGSCLSENKENTMHHVSHEVSNRKRCRSDLEEEDEVLAQPSPKKQKGHSNPNSGYMTSIVKQASTIPTSTITSPIKNNGITRSRLNMLARPKVRK